MTTLKPTIRDNVFHCPHCGKQYLHHYRVDVFECDEDEETGLHVRVDRDKRLVCDSDLRQNPSARRHGLTVRFQCEICAGYCALEISQHKGNTFVELRLMNRAGALRPQHPRRQSGLLRLIATAAAAAARSSSRNQCFGPFERKSRQ